MDTKRALSCSFSEIDFGGDNRTNHLDRQVACLCVGEIQIREGFVGGFQNQKITFADNAADDCLFTAQRNE